MTLMRKTCGECRFFGINTQDLGRGTCNQERPQVFPLPTTQGLQIINARPEVGRGDVACQRFDAVESVNGRSMLAR